MSKSAYFSIYVDYSKISEKDIKSILLANNKEYEMFYDTKTFLKLCSCIKFMDYNNNNSQKKQKLISLLTQIEKESKKLNQARSGTFTGLQEFIFSRWDKIDIDDVPLNFITNDF